MRPDRLLLTILLTAFSLPAAALDATEAPAQTAPSHDNLPVAEAPVAEAPVAEAPVQAAPPVPAGPPPSSRFEAPYVSARRAELAELDARLHAIRRELPGLAGPIVLTAVAGGVTLVSAYAATMLWIVSQSSNDGYYRGDRYYEGGYYAEGHYRDQRDPERRAARGLAAVSLASLATSLGGVLWMTSRLRERRAYKPELDGIKSQRRLLLQEIRYGVNASTQHYGLSMTAAF